jgi:hypothetical protein
MKDEPVTWKQVKKITELFFFISITIFLLYFNYDYGIKNDAFLEAYFGAFVIVPLMILFYFSYTVFNSTMELINR